MQLENNQPVAGSFPGQEGILPGTVFPQRTQHLEPSAGQRSDSAERLL
jgi:hypothetical protein